MPGEHLDLSSDPQPPRREREKGGVGALGAPHDAGQRFLGVHFACCNTYARVYVNREGTEYVGHCPRCFARAKFVIGEQGQSGRFFSVS
jgi:hypothetical protein